jgi:hypothetical protein
LLLGHRGLCLSCLLGLGLCHASLKLSLCPGLLRLRLHVCLRLLLRPDLGLCLKLGQCLRLLCGRCLLLCLRCGLRLRLGGGLSCCCCPCLLPC